MNVEKAREWFECEKRKNAPPHIRFYAMSVLCRALAEEKAVQVKEDGK